MHKLDKDQAGTPRPTDSFLTAHSVSRARLGVTCAVVGLSALLLFLAKIQQPDFMVFDESSYISIARGLLARDLPPLQPDSALGRQHPPLGSWLIAQSMRLGGDNPRGWRLASALAGTLALIAIFLWTYLLLRNYGLALLAAFLTLFNNFLYVMARVAMLDIFAVAFCLWGLLAFTAAATEVCTVGRRRTVIIFSGLAFGLALACKWNAVDTFAVCFAVALVLYGISRTSAAWTTHLQATAQNVRSIGLPVILLAFIAAPACGYVAGFLPLFRAARMPFSFSELFRMHAVMLAMNRNFAGNPALYAAWYTWPFRVTPVRGLSYLMGNWVVMWGGLAALAVAAWRLRKPVTLPGGLVLMLYFANLLQWALTPLKVPNYYYYFSAAMFLGPAIAVALNRPVAPRIFGLRISLLAAVAAFVFFLYCYPRMAHLQAPWDCMFGCWD